MVALEDDRFSPAGQRRYDCGRDRVDDRTAATRALRGWRLREDRDGRLSERWRLSKRATLYYASGYGQSVAGYACRVEDLSIYLEAPRVGLNYRQAVDWCASYYYARLRDIAAGRESADDYGGHGLLFGFCRTTGVVRTREVSDDNLYQADLRDELPYDEPAAALAYAWIGDDYKRVAPRTATNRFLLQHYQRIAAEHNARVLMQPHRVRARLEQAVRKIREFVKEQKRKAS